MLPELDYHQHQDHQSELSRTHVSGAHQNRYSLWFGHQNCDIFHRAGLKTQYSIIPQFHYSPAESGMSETNYNTQFQRLIPDEIRHG